MSVAGPGTNKTMGLYEVLFAFYEYYGPILMTNFNVI